MCVIAVCDRRRANDVEVEKMYAQNPHFSGIAWREKDEVCWEKGLDLEEIKVLNEVAPLPYVLHFRIETTGGKHKELCHPFPVEKAMRTDLSGHTKGSVLFHNGTMHLWRERGLDAIIKNGVKVPDGRWSDSRVMAFLTHLHGKGVLELIDEKVILFSPKAIEVFKHSDFSRVNDLLVSNRLWENRWVGGNRVDLGDDENWEYYYNPRQRGGANDICQWGNCKEKPVGNSKYCAVHAPKCIRINCNKQQVGGSDFCEEHQPMCLWEKGKDKCYKQRVPGEKLCVAHLVEAGEKAKRVREAHEEAARKAREHASKCIVHDCNQQAEADSSYCSGHQTCHHQGCYSFVLPGTSFCKEHQGGSSAATTFRTGSEHVDARGDRLGTAEKVSEGVPADVSDAVVGSDLKAADAAAMKALADSSLQEAFRWAASLNPKALRTSHTHQELIRLTDLQKGVM